MSGIALEAAVEGTSEGQKLLLCHRLLLGMDPAGVHFISQVGPPACPRGL